MFIQQIIIEHLLCAKHCVASKLPGMRNTDMVPPHGAASLTSTCNVGYNCYSGGSVEEGRPRAGVSETQQ